MKKALFTKLLVLLAAFLWAQDVKWYAKVPEQVYADGVFEIQFVLENANGKSVKFPSFDGLEILSGPSVSEQFNYLNGQSSSSIIYSFEAVAEKTGKIQLGSASIWVKGKTYTTPPATILVKKSDRKSGPKQEEIAFVNLHLSKERIYKGQQIIAAYQLYFKGNLGFEDAIQHPPFNEFYVTQLDDTEDELPGMEIRGQNYRGVLADALALFPKTSGRITIGKSYFPMKERLQNDDPWSYPFGKYRPLTLTSPEKVVEVIELPAPVPENFNGVVGNYEGSALLAENKIAANQTILVRVEIKGNGDPSTMSPPRLILPPQLEAYPAKLLKEGQFSQNKQLQHSHIWEIPVTAKDTGHFEIKVDFLFFDPKSTAFESIEFPSLDVEVKKAILQPTLVPDSPQKKQSWPYYLLGVSSIVASFLIWLFFRKKEVKGEEIQSEEKFQIELAKPENPTDRLSQISLLWEEEQFNAFYTQLSLLLQEVLKDQLGLAAEEQDKTLVVQLLKNITSSPEAEGLFLSVRSGIELALYGGGIKQNGPELLTKTRKLIELLTSLTQTPMRHERY